MCHGASARRSWTQPEVVVVQRYRSSHKQWHRKEGGSSVAMTSLENGAAQLAGDVDNGAIAAARLDVVAAVVAAVVRLWKLDAFGRKKFSQHADGSCLLLYIQRSCLCCCFPNVTVQRQRISSDRFGFPPLLFVPTTPERC